LTNPISRGDPCTYASNSISRGMSFFNGSEGSVSDIEKYDNNMIDVIYDIFNILIL
jgi:hypothetical protein